MLRKNIVVSIIIIGIIFFISASVVITALVMVPSPVSYTNKETGKQYNIYFNSLVEDKEIEGDSFTVFYSYGNNYKDENEYRKDRYIVSMSIYIDGEEIQTKELKDYFTEQYKIKKETFDIKFPKQDYLVFQSDQLKKDAGNVKIVFSVNSSLGNVFIEEYTFNYIVTANGFKISK